MLLPKVELGGQVIQIRVRSESGTSPGVLEDRAQDETPHGAKKEALVDGTIGCSPAGVKVVDESSQDFPDVFTCLESECTL